MRVTLLTVVVALSALTIQSSAAADPECVYRQIRSLPAHWANPADCGRFYRCTNKNVKREVVCAADKEYNSKTGKCASAGKGYCKLSLAAPIAGDENVCANEVTGAYVPQDGHCRDFYICNDNLAYPQNCDPGSLFNTTTASCVPDTNTVCWQNFCLNQRDGTYLGDSTSCLTFYICNAEETIAQSCDPGSYYNKTTNNCQPDVDNAICWENYCLNADSGTTVKNPANCHGFYACNDKVATAQECPEGDYYDWETNTCEPGECPDNETTTPGCEEPTTSAPCESCTCPGGYHEGQLLPHPGNCMYYYVCADGVLVQDSCLEGNFFNKTLEACQPDTTGACPDCMKNYRRARREVDEESSEDMASFSAEQVEEAVAEPKPSCLDRYFDGDMAPHDECNKYQICFEGEMHTHECGAGSYYNNEFQACLRDEENICKTKTNGDEPKPSCLDRYFEGEVAPHEDCDKFMMCIDGEMRTNECVEGDYFHHELLVCLPDVDNVCRAIVVVEPVVEENAVPAAIDNAASTCGDQDQSGCTCPGGYQPGEMVAHPNDCDKYYICENGQLILSNCGQGNMFSSCDGRCIPDTEGVCWPNEPGCGGDTPSPSPDPSLCVGQANGQLLPADKCTDFYQCLNGVPILQNCTTGLWFNPVTRACEVDANGICVNPCAGITGIEFLPHPDCSKFYFCNNEKMDIDECPDNMGFDVDAGVCLKNATCEANMCKNKPDGTTYPVAGDIYKFYVCQSGVASIRDCPSNSQFNEQIGICLQSPSSNCNQTVCQPDNVLGAFPTLSSSETSFCSCRGQNAFEFDCPQNLIFDAVRGVCYSNAPCDPEVCLDSTEYSVFWNRNDSQSFCLCVMKQPVIVDCPNNGTFYPRISRCRGPTVQDPNCNPTYCLDQLDYTTAPSLTGNSGFCYCVDGGSTYRECLNNYTFVPSLSICLPPSSIGQLYCDVSGCEKGPNTIFAAQGDQTAFCYCLNTTNVEVRNCPANTTFDPVTLVCMKNFCDSTQCLNSANQGVPFPAINFPYGYCMCNGTNADVYECNAGEIFDTDELACTDEVNIMCSITQCQVAGKPYPYPTPAKNDQYSFCYCTSSSTVYLFTCPLGKYYDEYLGICVEENSQPPTECDTCTCPGGYAAGSILPHPQYCSQYYICSSGVLQLYNCGASNFFNASLGACQPGTCTDVSTPCTCVGAYREGEMIANPNNRNMYYRCQNAQLHEEICPIGRYFSAQQSTCVPEANTQWYYKPRSIVSEELPSVTSTGTGTEDIFCRDNTKRSVPSNCSQYEICQNEQWSRRTCPNQRYYNPEEQKCLEPRDDTICSYAKLSGIPACTSQTEQQTLPHKRATYCAHYYRCMRGKWRLKNCGKNEFYSRLLRTCLPTTLKNVCQARNASEAVISGQLANTVCRHTAMRPFVGNCAKYLMCLEGVWWYQYCPLGMYFNETVNYCLPDADGHCANESASKNLLSLTQTEFSDENCTHDGELRASALACDRYYICMAGQWRQQSCGKGGLYFNVTSENCVNDTVGFCQQLKAACYPGERREFPLNCTAFEICEDGVWKRSNCERNWTYDILLRQCVPNTEGFCSINGLRKACQSGEIRAWPIADNCTQFLYCEADIWRPGACLKGHTYVSELRTCVPHDPENRCKPMWNATESLTVLPPEMVNTSEETEAATYLPGNDNACLERDDGTTVPHPSDCTRFYMCLRETMVNEQQCAVGSFFDASLGYCRPNDGRCSVPLTGACKNASDGDLLPNPEDCRAYYYCSTLNGTQMLSCPNGEYYHKQSQQCRVDRGECREPSAQHKCAELTEHGTKLPHERYCNIYYACVRGLAIPIECPNGQQFNPVLERCLDDVEQQCLNGELVNKNETTYSCGNLTDGTYLPNHSDCTRYYICSNGHAQPKRCASGAYFDSQQLLCVPDDNSCPFVDSEPDNNKPIPPDPIICEGKHGLMLPDPANCNEFYVCINSKLRHERCYVGYFFNATSSQCQPYDSDNGSTTTTSEATTVTEPTDSPLTPETPKMTATQQKCTDKPTNFTDVCTQIPEGTSIAEQGDCRRYISCQDNEPTTQRCRNGESYDSLLGFCRQNDGTCLLENGQRVGVCNGRHGQLARDTENCRGYFVCINGQKISGECAENEWFDRTENMCQQDVLMQCSTSPKTATTEDGSVSCKGLSEGILYPYIYDNCRSYFQCVKGVPKVHECADGLYFDANTTRCIKEVLKCAMPITGAVSNLLRAPEVITETTTKHRCEGAIIGKPYANLDDHCCSYYVCDGPETIAYTTCPQGTLYNTDKRACVLAEYVVCRL